MINFDPNDPDVRHLEVRSGISTHESCVRKALRTGAFDTFYDLLDQQPLSTQEIEGCLMLLMVSYGRKTPNDQNDAQLRECADALLARVTEPLTLLELVTYNKGIHVPLVRKFIPHCTASVITVGMLSASQSNNQQLFDLLYPHSDIEKAHRFLELLTDAQRVLFDERIAQERCHSVLNHTVAEHGTQRGERKL